MSILDLLSQKSVWESFYEYKLSLAVPKSFTGELRAFIDGERYMPVCESIKEGRAFPLPKRSVISKMGSNKKRVVYTYPEPENTVLKLLTHLLLRKYDGLFYGTGLYSFRPGRTAKDAVRALLKIGAVPEMYSYKADIHDYFNSIPVEKLLPMLEKCLSDDERLFEFLKGLLTEPCVLDRGRPVSEKKGIMAGTPLSSFCANLYLSELDRRFANKGIIYARYSDDVILFAQTEEEARAHAEYIHGFLDEMGLEINPAKESFSKPGEGFVFLGFSVKDGSVDIAPATVRKLKQKMRRKRDALARWYKRNGYDGEKAAKAFIRIFDRKLLESPRDNELSWSSWFFPVIDTAKSLHAIDVYAEDCLRYLISGTHTKSRFNVRYDDLKALGFKSLVNEFYSHKERTS